jgi:hypothetical protein
MLSNIVDMKGTARHGTWLWRRVALPLLLALLALGFVGLSTGLASSSAPLRPATASSQQADGAPAMMVLNGTVYVGWTGRNAAHNLNLMTYTPTSKVFGPAQVLTDTTLVGQGPSLANFNGNLYVAWMGNDHRLNVGRYDPAHPSVLANKVTLRESSNQAPALAAFQGRLYLSWRGADGHLNIISSANASTFSTKVTYSVVVRTSPSLVAKNMFLFVAWEDMSADSHIVFARYDPAQPSDLQNVVTVASTSQLPVGLAPAGVASPSVVVAWRTATDAHVRTAVFEGGPFLHNPVYTAETTNYGPALYSPYMSWTGTNAAQNVNVSIAKIFT